MNGVARNEVGDGEVPERGARQRRPGHRRDPRGAPHVGPVPQAASRDFYMEQEALKARIADAKTDGKGAPSEIKGTSTAADLRRRAEEVLQQETHGAPTKNASTEAAQ